MASRRRMPAVEEEKYEADFEDEVPAGAGGVEDEVQTEGDERGQGVWEAPAARGQPRGRLRSVADTFRAASRLQLPDDVAAQDNKGRDSQTKPPMDIKYKALSEDYDCSLKTTPKWEEKMKNHIELEDTELEGTNLNAILSGFFNDKLTPDEVDKQRRELEAIAEFKAATIGGDKYFFAYASDWKTYYENSLECKTKTIVKSNTDIETVGISMKLTDVFLLFPSETFLVIACRADNNLERQAKDDPTKSVSSTKNTALQTSASYQGQKGGAATNFGVTVDYDVVEYITTMKPRAREQSKNLTNLWKAEDGYDYQQIGTDEAQANLRNMTKIMMKRMGKKLSGARNLLNFGQSGSEKMQDMELHVYRIKKNPQLKNKLFAANDYTTKIVNIKFPNNDRVLTFGSISAPNQFLQYDKGGWIDFIFGNTTTDVEASARNSVGPSQDGGNLNKKQLRNKLNTMSMRELRKLHREENVSMNNNRSIKGLVNNYMRYHNASNN